MNRRIEKLEQRLAAVSYEQLGDTGRAFEHDRAYLRIKEEVFSSDSNTRLKNLLSLVSRQTESSL